MKRNHRLVSVALSLALLCAGGCGSGPRLFVSSQADMTFYKKVAVLSFANFTAEPYAGDRVTRAFVTELIIADRFELVDPGSSAPFSASSAPSPTPRAPTTLRRSRAPRSRWAPPGSSAAASRNSSG